MVSVGDQLAAGGPTAAGGAQAHSEAADTNASNVPSVGVSQTSEGQGSAIQPARSAGEESAFSAAEEVAGPSRTRGLAGTGRGSAGALRPTTSMISTAVQRPASPPHQHPGGRGEQHAQSPKAYRTHSVVSQTLPAGASAAAQHHPADAGGAGRGSKLVKRGGTPASMQGQTSHPAAAQLPPRSSLNPSAVGAAASGNALPRADRSGNGAGPSRPNLSMAAPMQGDALPGPSIPDGGPTGPSVQAWQHTLQQLELIQQLVAAQPQALVAPDQPIHGAQPQGPGIGAGLGGAAGMAAAVGLLLPGMASLIHGTGGVSLPGPHHALGVGMPPGQHGGVPVQGPLHFLLQGAANGAPPAGVAAGMPPGGFIRPPGSHAPQPGHSAVGSVPGPPEQPQQAMAQAAMQLDLASPALSLVCPSAPHPAAAHLTPAATQAASVSTAPVGSAAKRGGHVQANAARPRTSHPQGSAPADLPLHGQPYSVGPHDGQLAASAGPAQGTLIDPALQQGMGITLSMLSAHHNHPLGLAGGPAQGLPGPLPAYDLQQQAAVLAAAAAAAAPAVSVVGTHATGHLAGMLADARPAGGSATYGPGALHRAGSGVATGGAGLMQAGASAMLGGGAAAHAGHHGTAHLSDSCITQQQGTSLHASALQQPPSRQPAGATHQAPHGEADGDNDACDDNEGVLATNSAGGGAAGGAHAGGAPSHVPAPHHPASSTAARHSGSGGGPQQPSHDHPAHGPQTAHVSSNGGEAPVGAVGAPAEGAGYAGYACDPATSVHAQVATNEPAGGEVAMGMSVHYPAGQPHSWAHGGQPQHSGPAGGGADGGAGGAGGRPDGHHHAHHRDATMEPTSSQGTRHSSPPPGSTTALVAGAPHVAPVPAPAPCQQHGSAGSWQAAGEPAPGRSPSPRPAPPRGDAAREAGASRQGSPLPGPSMGAQAAGSRGMSGVVMGGRQGPDSSLAMATAGPSTRSATISGGGAPSHSNTVELSWRADSQMAEASQSSSGDTAVSHGAEAGGMQLSAERAYSVERASRSHVEAPGAGGGNGGGHAGPRAASDVEDEGAGPQHALNVGSPMAASVAGGSTLLAGPDTPTAADLGPGAAALGSTGWAAQLAAQLAAASHHNAHSGHPQPGQQRRGGRNGAGPSGQAGRPHALVSSHRAAQPHYQALLHQQGQPLQQPQAAVSTMSNTLSKQARVGGAVVASGQALGAPAHDPGGLAQHAASAAGAPPEVAQSDGPGGGPQAAMPHASSLAARMSGEMDLPEGPRMTTAQGARHSGWRSQGGHSPRNAEAPTGEPATEGEEELVGGHPPEHALLQRSHPHPAEAEAAGGAALGCPSVDTTASRPQDADVQGGSIHAGGPVPPGGAWPQQSQPQMPAEAVLNGAPLQADGVGGHMMDGAQGGAGLAGMMHANGIGGSVGGPGTDEEDGGAVVQQQHAHSHPGMDAGGSANHHHDHPLLQHHHSQARHSAHRPDPHPHSSKADAVGMQPSSRSASRQPSGRQQATCNGEQEASWLATGGSHGSIGEAGEQVGQWEVPPEHPQAQSGSNGAALGAHGHAGMGGENGGWHPGGHVEDGLSLGARRDAGGRGSVGWGSGSSINGSQRPSKRKRSAPQD